MKKILTAAALLALTASSASFAAETLEDTDNHGYDKAYNVNNNSEFFVYLGGRGGIANYFGDMTAYSYEAFEQGQEEIITTSISDKITGWGAGFVGLGYRSGRIGVRGELEASFYGNNDLTENRYYVLNAETGELKAIQPELKLQTYMANFYADAYAQKNCVFYLMAGLGDAHLKYNGGEKDHLAWQVGIGGQYYFVKHFGGEIGVRYQDLGKVVATDGTIVEPEALQLYVGLLTRF